MMDEAKRIQKKENGLPLGGSTGVMIITSVQYSSVDEI